MPALERFTQWLLHLEPKRAVLPSFTEFWHAEMEIAWASNDDVMKHGEAVVRHIAKLLLDERSDELTSLERDLDLIARYADSKYLKNAV